MLQYHKSAFGNLVAKGPWGCNSIKRSTEISEQILETKSLYDISVYGLFGPLLLI